MNELKGRAFYFNFEEIRWAFCGCRFRVGLNHEQVHRFVIWICCVYIYRYIEMFLQLQVPLCPKGFFLFMSQLQSSKQMWNEQLKYLLHKIFCSKLCPSLMASFSFIELCVSVSLKIKVKVSLCCCKQNFIITISTRILFSTIHNLRCDVNFHNNSPVMYDKCVFLILIFS